MSVKAAQQDSGQKVQESNERPKDQPAAQTQSFSGMAPALLNLQRTHGNRYVQSMLSVARKAEGEAEVSREAEVEAAIKRADGGQPLDERVRGQMESAMGADFSGVRVHADAEADALSRALSARAFTTGNDIFFRQGEYEPGSYKGRELLAHELAHVVQQNGRGGGVQEKLSISEPGDAYEQEADEVAKAVMQRETEGASQGDQTATASSTYPTGTLTGNALSAHEAAHGAGHESSHESSHESGHELGQTVVASSLTAAEQPVRPQLTSGPRLARNGDGGAPAPARTPPRTPPRTPATTPSTTPSPAPTQTPTPAPAAVTVSIATVNAPHTPGTVRRIPPRVDTSVAVTVSGTPSSPITLSIDGGSAANGTATINGTATHNITSSETVRLRGDTQTTPGNAAKLKLVADQGGTRLASSNAFSVAAYPIEIGFNFDRIVQAEALSGMGGGLFWGAAYDVTFTSDSGLEADCNETKVSENVFVDTATGIFAGATSIQSNFIQTTSPQRDHHVIGASNEAAMRSLIASDSSSRSVVHQLFRFADARTGIAENRAAGPTVPTSGFRVSRALSAPSTCGGSNHIIHTKKEGFANNGVAAGAVNDTGIKDAIV